MPQNLSSAELTELVCTRLSHDLIGTVGAVANAVELMEDNDPETLGDVKPILEISAKTLSARLKFFRLAFGLNNASVKSAAELQTIAEQYLATIGSRSAPIRLEFSIATPQLYKYILLGVMAFGDVFIRGGNLKVSENAHGLFLKANSPSPLATGKLAVLQAVIAGKTPEDNPSQSAPLLYMSTLLAGRNVKLELNYDTSQAELKIG